MFPTPRTCLLITLCALLFTAGIATATDRLVPDTYATVQAAYTAAAAGDTIKLAAGDHVLSGSLAIAKSITIEGAGRDTTTLRRSGAPGSSGDTVLNITAANVTVKNLTLGWVAPTPATKGRGYVIQTNKAFTKVQHVKIGENYRSGVVCLAANNFEVSDCLFTGFMNDGCVRGSGDNFLITRNKFEENHYNMGPILIDYSDPWGGEISYNYFGNGVEPGYFESTGKGLYTIVVWNGNLSATGLTIAHNTFAWQDKATANQAGKFAEIYGIYYDPYLGIPADKVVIRDNIFTGFDHLAQPAGAPTPLPLWRPSAGKFGGALEFSGAGDFAWFQDPTFDVGSRGTLSFWVNMHDQSRRNQFFEGPGDGGFEFQYRENGSGQFYGRPNTGGDYAIEKGPASGTTNTWINLQFTWDVTTHEMHLYKNGTEVVYVSTTYNADIGNWTPATVTNTLNGIMSVGRDPGDPSRSFDGLLDDIVWYDAVLDQTQRDTIRTGSAAALTAVTPVAYWDLDQAAGLAAYDSSHNIALHLAGPEPAWVQPTVAGRTGAHWFNATQFGTFHDPAFNIGSAGTLVTWVKLDTLGKRHDLFRVGGMDFQVRDTNEVFFYTNKGNNGESSLVHSTTTIPDLGWHHLAFTWDLASTQAHIYLDGTEVAYRSGYGTSLAGEWTMAAETRDVLAYVGRDPGDISRALTGLLDDMAIFNTALTPAEINTLHTTGLAANPALVAAWSFDTASETTIPAAYGTTLALSLRDTAFVDQTYAVRAPFPAIVTNNLFYQNAVDAVPLGSANLTGLDPRFAATGADLADYYALQFGSPAVLTASDHTNIGASQLVPTGPVTEVWVDADWAGTLPSVPVEPGKIFGMNAFAVIQDGLNAVQSEGTVHIAAGHYAENLQIVKTVTIDGAGSGLDGTVVVPAGGAALTLQGVTQPSSISGLRVQGTPAIQLTDVTGDVTLTQLTLAGAEYLHLTNTPANVTAVTDVTFDGAAGHPQIEDGIWHQHDLPSLGLVSWGDTRVPLALALPAASGRTDSMVTLRATLTRADTSAPLAGQVVTFSVNNLVVGTAMTNTYGIASLSYSLAGKPAQIFTILARYAGDATYQAIAATAPLTVSYGVVTAIASLTGPAQVVAGQSATYALEVTDGTNTWPVVNGVVWLISSDAAGSWSGSTYTSRRAGPWTVTALYQGCSATHPLEVSPAAAATVTVTPATATIDAGSTMTYTAVASDLYGNKWPVTGTATWDDQAADGDFTGNVYTAGSGGTVLITATVDGVTSTPATLTVRPNAGLYTQRMLTFDWNNGTPRFRFGGAVVTGDGWYFIGTSRACVYIDITASASKLVAVITQYDANADDGIAPEPIIGNQLEFRWVKNSRYTGGLYTLTQISTINGASATGTYYASFAQTLIGTTWKDGYHLLTHAVMSKNAILLSDTPGTL